MSAGLTLTVAEYDRMVEKGAFDELAQKIELINGEIQAMNPAGPAHDDFIQYLAEWSFRNSASAEVGVRIQSGLSIPEHESRPEPDVLWVRAGRYIKGHPTAADALLLIEVSYSSLKSDQQDKEQLYAKAAIQEYWIVDIVGEQIHVHREPDGGVYRSITVVKPGDVVSPLVSPEATLVVNQLFAKD
jgi:Uma2 family endonuclease